MKPALPLMIILSTTSAIAEDTRQLDTHEHGVGALNVALEGTTVAMEFHAPGADIVGFEYEAKSADDRAAIDAAVATLARPLDLFVLPADAACSVTRATAELEKEEGADDHDAHDDHPEEASHAEFHADYMLTCANPAALTEITFAYFEVFENAVEVEVQVITSAGAQAFEVERDNPTLDLRSLY